MSDQRFVIRQRNKHSSTFALLFSSPSAGFPNIALQTWDCIISRTGNSRISRLGIFEVDSLRQMRSSSTLVPIRYPRVLSLLNPVSTRATRTALRSDYRPSFEIINAANTLLGILNGFREQEGKCRGRDLRSTGLVEIAIVDVG